MPAEHGEPLSPRELEIVAWVSEGLTNREIAERAYLSPNTVKVHLRNIFTKTGVASRTELSMLAVREGWVDVPQEETATKPSLEETAGPEAAPAPALPPWPAARWVALVFGLALALGVLVLPPGLRHNNNGATAAEALVDLPESVAAVPLPVAEDNWAELSPLPVRRARLGLTAYDGNLFAIGGLGPEGPSARLDIYDIAADRWTTGAARPLALANVGAVALDDRILVPGGCDAQGIPVPVVHAYATEADAWETPAPLPEPLCAYALAAFEGAAYLFGGWNGSQYRDVAYRYAPETNVWTAIASPPTARAFGAAGALGNRIFYIGGYDGAERATCEAYMPEENRWESCAPLLLPRGGLSLAAAGGHLYAIGGGWENYLGFNERYLPQEDAWVVVESPLVGEWRNLGLASWETSLYAVGGWNGDYSNLTYGFEVLPFRVFIPVTLP